MGKKAVVIKGDGIGPETVNSMLKVLSDCGFSSEIIELEAGSEQWDKNGRKDPTYIPDITMNALESSDACFKGPTTTIPSQNAPRSVAVTLRQKFELYSNIRPCKTFERLTPNRSLDCVCFREATEGLYSGEEVMTSPDSAIAIRKITRKGCKRFAQASAHWAEEHDMKKMVAITKRNILKMTDGIFLEEMQKAADTVPGLNLSEIYIDNMAQQMIVATEQFNGAVLASTNLFMDIISELASGLIGSIGLIYSANMGDKFAMFEAAHGSAPSLTGKNIANPTATILSSAWMAEYLGEKHVRDAIFDATWQIINEGKYVTSDIGGNATTTQMANAISDIACKHLKK
ncbi:MAG: isocitrate dehydrogenase [Cenarchaeum symbiont of Oopsacas minuta]|nr:isocitrate dehydrogenase [Cenarchaeum symbiont of Oopsacas minuta]